MKKLKRFISYYKPHRFLFFADLFAALLLAACDIFYPMVTRLMLNEYIRNNQLKKLLIVGGFLLIVFGVKYFLNYFVTYYGHVMGVRMQRDMQRDLFSHIEKLPVSFFDEHKTGSLMSRITTDLFDISELAHHGPEDVFLSLFMLIGSFIMLLNVYWKLALIVFAIFPVFIIIAGVNRAKLAKTSAESKAAVAEINAGLENSISGVRVTKAYTAQQYEKDHFEENAGLFVKVRGLFYKAMGRFSAGSTLVTDILHLTMYLAGGLFCYFDKDFTVIDFTTFVLYISVFTTPIRKLIAFVEQYQSGMAGFERFSEIMETPCEEDDDGAVDAGELRGDIEFNNVSFSYETGGEVLHDLSLRVEKGKKLALVGLSGGGKTTICHLILRYYECKEGEIRIDGRDIRSFTRESLRRNVGIVAQDTFLFNDTIEANIRYGSFDATEEELITAAKAANIHDFIMSLPDGYKTVVGERGVKLSGGQKQRVAIARVFLNNPPILILDEATSALDTANEIQIGEALDALSVGRTTVVVAHRLSTVMDADEILVVNDGAITERGTHSELLAQNGVYSKLWSVNMRAGK